MILFMFTISPDSCPSTSETDLTLPTLPQWTMSGSNGLWGDITRHIRKKRTGKGSSEADRVFRNQQAAFQNRPKRGEAQIPLKTNLEPKETPLNPRDLFHPKKENDEGRRDCVIGVDRRDTLHSNVPWGKTKISNPRSVLQSQTCHQKKEPS